MTEKKQKEKAMCVKKDSVWESDLRDYFTTGNLGWFS